MTRQQFTIPQQFTVGNIKIDTKAQLERTYLRLLLDAFVPYQEAMLTYLDELLTKHDPLLVQRQLDEHQKQDQEKSKEWKQTHLLLQQADEAEQEKIIGRLHDIHDEEWALHQIHMELLKKLDIETHSQTILKHKRENILKLLQRRQAMIEEGTWEKIGGKDKMSHIFSLLGDDSIGFGFSKITLQASPINDIFDWMTQHHPALLPPADPFPPSPASEQATISKRKEVPSKPKTEFLHVPDEVTASITTFLAIRRPGYTLLYLLDRSSDDKRAMLALLTRKLHSDAVEYVTDVIIELEQNKYMTIQNVQDLPATQPSPGPHSSS